MPRAAPTDPVFVPPEKVTLPDLTTVAVTIGHHFWNCEDDDRAFAAGRDAAVAVLEALEE